MGLEITKDNLDIFDLAIKIHTWACHYNHTDGCGWLYEIREDGEHEWDKISHKNYLELAAVVLKLMIKFNLSFNDFIEIIKTYRKVWLE